MDNAAKVYDVLCEEEAWRWDTDDGHKLVFYRDGTGEITSRAELNIWIVAFFEWKVHDPASVEYTDSDSDTAAVQPSFIYSLLGRSPPPPLLRASIEFTLTKRRPLLYGQVVRHRINEEVLLDAAFEPRVLHVTVERGRFTTPWPGTAYDHETKFRLRLSFDVSPYPPRDAWRPAQYAMVDSMKQPEMWQFCAQELPARKARTCVVM
ncbi:hypothetical protein C8R43DRAFT_1236360 [Mycena crocata]|nr:hypothetical protein C8R43DRAFT_1236360 [Mycena crocata]